MKIRNYKIPGFNLWLGCLLLTPVLSLIIFVSYIPFVWNLILSFQKWNGFMSKSWVKFDNYSRLLNDQTAHTAFYNTTYLGVFITLFAVLLGVFLAACIYPLGQKEGAIFRLTLFSPTMVPTSIIAIMFTFILNPIGVLNKGLEAIGLESWTRVWLGEAATVLPSIVAVDVYKSMGITMLISFTAMQMIPKSLLEAAKLEGISYIRQFTLIILPLIKPIVQLCVIITLISAFRTYDSVRILTNGGPGNMSKIVSLYMIENAFFYSDFGYAASMGAVFTLILLLSVLIVRKTLGGETHEY